MNVLMELSSLLFLTAIAMIWLSTLWLVPACLLLMAMRRSGPATESLAGRVVLMGMFALPLVMAAAKAGGFTRTAWNDSSTQVSRAARSNTVNRVEELPTTMPLREYEQGTEEFTELTAATAAAQTYQQSSGGLESRGDLLHVWYLVAGGLWMATSCYLLSRLWLACRTIRSLRREALRDESSQGLCRRLADKFGYSAPLVVRSPRVSTPCLAGVFSPVIVLPTDVDYPSSTLNNVLMHELAHVGRRDVLWSFLFRISVALIPFQPCLWWLLRRQEIAAEQASDDLVVRCIDQPATYAQLLLDLASQHMSARPIGVGMIARRSLLRTRIQRILDDHCLHGRRPSLAIRLLLISALGLQGGLISFALLPVALPAATRVAPMDQTTADEKATKDDWLLSGQVLDVAGQPAVGASVLIYANNYWNFRRTLVTDAQGHFSSRLNDELGEFTDLEIVARSADGRSLVVDGASRPRRGQASPALKLQLEPERQIELQVVDQTGQAVAAAKAAVQIGGLYLTESTNAQGVATFKVPERQHISRVAAWKNEVGFDFVAYDPPTSAALSTSRNTVEFPASGAQQLKLTGAKTVPIFVTDVDGRALPNIKIYVGQFQKSESQSFSTGNLEVLSQARFSEPTDALGRTEIACVPNWQAESLKFWPDARDYEIKFVTHPVWSNEPVRLKLERKVPIRGRVTLPGGQPAKGIRVTASGDTYTDSVVEDHAMTGADGRYELLVPPNHLYMVTVEGEAVAAVAQTIVLRSGQSANDLDFQLRPATRVTGRVIDKDSGEPIADAYLFLDQYGPTLRTANTALPQAYADDSAQWSAPRVHRSVEADASGRYEFSLGDGEFELHTGMAGGSRTIRVNGEDKIELDDIEVELQENFTGLVTLETDGSPVANAKIDGASFAADLWDLEANQAGRFKLHRSPGKATIRALSPDGKHGAIAVVTQEDSVELKLRPTGKVTGRLVSALGQPLAKRRVTIRVRVPADHINVHPDFAPALTMLHGMAFSNDSGQFELDHVVADQEYTIEIDGTRWKKIKVASGQTLDAGEFMAQ